MKRKLPAYRQFEYIIWRACERFGIRPEGVKDVWEDCDPWTQAKIIAYEQIREYEEAEEQMNLMSMLGARF